MEGKFTILQKLSFKSFFTKKRILISSIAAVLCVSLICFFVFGGKKEEDVKAAYVEAQAVVGDIIETIEQSGVIEPLDRYEITSRVKGEIIASPFEEGDYVNEGDTLYRIDDEDAQLSIEKAQNSIEKAEMSLEEIQDDIKKLDIFAPASGKLSDFDLEIGDSVGNGIIGNIVNTDVLTMDIPFSVTDFNLITVGDDVTITSALYMTSIDGKVTHKYDATAGTGSDGSVLKNIEIEIKNPGALAENTTFAATVHTPSGDIKSAGSGIVDKGTVTSLKSDVNGTVSSIAVKNGDYVTKGQLLVKLTNNSLVNSKKSSELNLKDSKLNMDSSRKTLEDYNITAPISGTIITKNSKAGDNIDNSSGQTVMMVIADMSKVKFTITVDELDISDIQLGQTAVVDADALPDETFTAVVTSIASEGVSSGDGVTTYEIELTIDEPGNLKSGMNVNANIFINEARNVLSIPEEAIMNVRGNMASVLVKSDGKENSTDKKEQQTAKEQKGEMPQKTDNAQNTETPQRPSAEQNGEMPQRPSNGQSGAMPTGGGTANIPEGYTIRQIEVGISDGTNIEVVSGLSEGDTIIYIPSTASSMNPFMRMMMGGGMMGGGMPGGNRNGGMNSGNRNSANAGVRR